MAPFPAYPDRSNYGTPGLAFIYTVTSVNKHKEEAFKVLASFFDKESLTSAARDGIVIPSVTDSSVLEQFGKADPIAAQINTGSLVKLKPSLKDTHPFLAKANSAINSQLWNVIGQTTDINTALRTAQEEIDKGWQQEKPNK